MSSHKIRKLQIGAGRTKLQGWLSSDLIFSDHAIFLDARKRFPFATDSFDYVYSEHMIEHLSWNDGLKMLKECLRILKPGGTLRIATPDLAVLIGLYNPNGHPLNEAFTKWITDRHLKDLGVYKAPFVINNAFYNWGHKFLYDAELLDMALHQSGFTAIQQCQPGESDDEHLNGIESHGKNVKNEAMVNFETMVFEAKSPG
jgi:predicted SAM-dependent methyltransferase